MDNTLPLYCVIDARETAHGVALDGNGDFVASCPDCSHAVKFPASDDLSALVSAHNAGNSSQVKVDENGSPLMTEAQQATLAAAVAADQAPADPAPDAQQ